MTSGGVQTHRYVLGADARLKALHNREAPRLNFRGSPSTGGSLQRALNTISSSSMVLWGPGNWSMTSSIGNTRPFTTPASVTEC